MRNSHGIGCNVQSQRTQSAPAGKSFGVPIPRLSPAPPEPIPPVTPLDWRAPVRRWISLPLIGRLPLADVAIAATFLLVACVEATFIVDYGASFTYVANTALTVAIAGAAAVRRKAVVGSFVVTYLALAGLAALVWFSPINLGLSPIVIAAPLSLWAVTRWARSRAWGLAGLLLGLIGSLLNPAVPAFGYAAERLLIFGLPTVLIIALCYAGASWLRTNAETHAAELASAISRSRLELSRELHDVVGHGLTAIKVQAQTALYLGESDSALRGVVEAADHSLRDVHALVDALRSGGEVSADAEEIPRIVAAALPTHRHVRVELPESFAPLATWPLARRLALVRAVAEVATNMAKYSDGPASLTVSVWEPEDVDASCQGSQVPDASGMARATVVAVNQISATQEGEDVGVGKRDGAGLAGLRERVGELGGSVTYGEVDGQFRVEVAL